MDILFAELLLRPSVAPALPGIPGPILQVMRQKPHLGASGSIDLWAKHPGGVLLIENKIDATGSVTAEGKKQPDRYRASVAALRERVARLPNPFSCRPRTTSRSAPSPGPST